MGETKTILLVCAMLLFASPALARDAELSRAYDRCRAEADGNDFPLINCMQQEHDRQDARLNAAYKKLMAAQKDGRGAKLREAQRAWIKFRDAYGDFLYDPDGGSFARVNSLYWHMTATADRARQIEDDLRRYPD